MITLTFGDVLGRLLEAAVVIIATYYLVITVLPYATKLLADIVSNKGLALAVTAFFGYVFVLAAVQTVLDDLSIGEFLTRWLNVLDPGVNIFVDLKAVLSELYAKAIIPIVLIAGAANGISNFLKINIGKKK